MEWTDATSTGEGWGDTRSLEQSRLARNPLGGHHPSPLGLIVSVEEKGVVDALIAGLFAVMLDLGRIGGGFVGSRGGVDCWSGR